MKRLTNFMLWIAHNILRLPRLYVPTEELERAEALAFDLEWELALKMSAHIEEEDMVLAHQLNDAPLLRQHFLR